MPAHKSFKGHKDIHDILEEDDRQDGARHSDSDDDCMSSDEEMVLCCVQTAYKDRGSRARPFTMLAGSEESHRAV